MGTDDEDFSTGRSVRHKRARPVEVLSLAHLADAPFATLVRLHSRPQKSNASSRSSRLVLHALLTRLLCCRRGRSRSSSRPAQRSRPILGSAPSGSKGSHPGTEEICGREWEGTGSGCRTVRPHVSSYAFRLSVKTLITSCSNSLLRESRQAVRDLARAANVPHDGAR